MLTTEQRTALATALRAETNPNVVAAMAVRNDTFLTEWCNSPSATDAWNPGVERNTLFEATNIAKFDGLTPGKRDAWSLILDNAPVDASRSKIRKAAEDIWGTSDSVAVLQDMLRKATNGEKYIGGTLVTSNTVAGLKLSFSGEISLSDVSAALNA